MAKESNKKSHYSHGGFVGGLDVGGSVVGRVGLATTGTIAHFPLRNLKSSIAISPV